MTYGANGSQYLEAEVLSRPREWLVPLLYEHLVANLRRAQVQIGAGDLPGKANSLERANGIVLELLSTLDMERGGELATRLAALYAFLAGEILMIGRSLEMERLERVIALVAELHEAWSTAAEKVAPRGRPGTPSLGAGVA